MIQLVCFDLDDTFWHNAPTLMQAEQTLHAWLCEHAPAMPAYSIEHHQTLRQQLVQQQPELRHRISALRQQALVQALQPYYTAPNAQQLAEAAFEVFLSARHQLTLFDDVVPTLETLRQQGYRLAVLTNGNADIRRVGLGTYFDVIVCAENLGIGKPDLRAFQTIEQRSGVAAPQIIHVGDHPRDDMLGALNAGWNAVWFNPQQIRWDTAQQTPHACIAQLHELPALLTQWSAPASN